MLITFSSKSSGDVVMLEKHALIVLNASGRHYQTLPECGVITHDQLADAIAHLEGTMQINKAENSAPTYEDEDRQIEKDGEKQHPLQEPVSLDRRAYPLLEMMKAALLESGDEIIWRGASAW